MTQSGKGGLRLRVENLFTIIAANIRMNYRYTLLPAIAFMFTGIPILRQYSTNVSKDFAGRIRTGSIIIQLISGSEFEIQVTFDRFKEIMDCVNNLIGRNSYFSRTMLSMYYYPNDMQ